MKLQRILMAITVDFWTRVVYFVGGFFVAVASMIMHGRHHGAEPDGWVTFLGAAGVSGLITAAVGPWYFTREQNRGRGTLDEVRARMGKTEQPDIETARRSERKE